MHRSNAKSITLLISCSGFEKLIPATCQRLRSQLLPSRVYQALPFQNSDAQRFASSISNDFSLIPITTTQKRKKLKRWKSFFSCDKF